MFIFKMTSVEANAVHGKKKLQTFVSVLRKTWRKDKSFKATNRVANKKSVKMLYGSVP